LYKKKWAFAADYIRLYALFKEGGIYLDSDVLVKKKFDDFLTSDFFTAVEYHHRIVDRYNTLELLNSDGTAKSSSKIKGIGIQSAILGGVKGHPFIKDCLDFYDKRRFILEDSSLYTDFIAPDIYARIAEKYGFRYIDEKQHLKNNMLILSSDIFAGEPSYEKNNSYAIHNCAGSWRDHKIVSLTKKISKYIRKQLN
jgi:mannosyltransferase OCH1-like enzyme